MVDAQSMWCGPGEQRRSWVKVATSAALDLMLPIERCLKITLKKITHSVGSLFCMCGLGPVETGPDRSRSG